MVVWTLTYTIVARHPTRAPIDTHLAIDDVVPIWRGAIWLYLAPYAVAPIVAALLTRATLAAALARAWATVATGIVVFLCVPTVVRRPAFASDGSLTARLHDVVLVADTPAGNAAPSLHVALAVLLAWALGRDRPRARALGWTFAAAIAASTLLTRQHHLVDVVTGALLAISVLLAGRLFEAARRRSPSPRPGGATPSRPPP
jgi:membrane-associated phospholipid phosphatase